MADATSGEVTMVDPIKIRDQFASMLQAKLVATSVSVKLLVHSGLRLVEPVVAAQSPVLAAVNNAAAGAVGGQEEGQTQITKHVGNAYEDSEITFEYEVRKMEEIEQLFTKQEQGTMAASSNVDAARTNGLPFQVQVRNDFQIW